MAGDIGKTDRAARQLLSGTPPAESGGNERLVQAMEAIWETVEAGQIPDRAALLAEYPDIAEELADCLDNLDFIRNVAPQLGDPQQPPARQSPANTRAAVGDFQILHEIGRGGMGVVYEAKQLSLNRRVALKVLPFAAMLDQRQLARFKNEAQAAASLTHQHIVPIYGVGSERGVHYYAMQFIEGEPLDRVITALRASA